MNRIFISTTYSERGFAEDLTERLRRQGLNPVYDVFEAKLAEEWLHHVLYNVESSDVVLLLMPEHDYESKWIHREINKNINYKLISRNILVIPVYLGRRKFLPSLNDQVSFFIENQSYSNSKKEYSEESIKKLVTYLSNLSKVNFENLDPMNFELLIVELLRKLRFFDIEHQRFGQDMGFDISAKTKTRNPFGGTSYIYWAIEIKYNRDSRADISSLKQLSYYLEEKGLDVNGVLITNGQLTSTAREWLEYNEKEKRTSIAVVDGVKLKQLIPKYSQIVESFFGARGGL